MRTTLPHHPHCHLAVVKLIAGGAYFRAKGRSQAWTHETLAQKEDLNLKKIVEVLIEGSRPEWNIVRGFSPAEKPYWHQFENLSLTDGVIYRKKSPATETEEEFQQILVPCGLRTEFLDAIHKDLDGHLRVTKTAAHVIRQAHWFNCRRDVNLYVKKCKMCCTYHRSCVQPKQGKLIPFLIGFPVERWACDLAGPFPKSALVHVYILTAICVFTMYIILLPLRDKAAISVAEAIFEKVFIRFGAGEILTDNGGEFCCEVLDELCRLMGVARSFTSSYQVRTNSSGERSHATVNAMLAKCTSINLKRLDL